MDKKSVDVLVIGAGPSGSVSASILAQNGLKVLIVEKQKFPRFVIGESLLPRCMHNLEKAGLLEDIEKAGFQKKKGARFNWGHDICDFEFANQYTKGWTWTWQVPRNQFDHILVQSAEKKGVEVIFESEVTSVDIESNGASRTSVKDKDGKDFTVEARFIIDASGYGRVLPRLLDLEKPSSLPSRTSFFAHIEEPNRPSDEEEHINIVVDNKNIWGWIIPFSDGRSSVGLAGESEFINRFAGDNYEQYQRWIQQIPILKQRFEGNQVLFEPRKLEGYSKAVKQLYGKGYVLTGNSSEFLDPVFSSGVTFATETGRLGAELAIKELSGEQVDWEKEYSEYINYGIEVFRVYVKKWYEGKLQKIFFSNRKSETIMTQICSVLAGYVWDKSNPFVNRGEKLIEALGSMV